MFPQTCQEFRKQEDHANQYGHNNSYDSCKTDFGSSSTILSSPTRLIFEDQHKNTTTIDSRTRILASLVCQPSSSLRRKLGAPSLLWAVVECEVSGEWDVWRGCFNRFPGDCLFRRNRVVNTPPFKVTTTVIQYTGIYDRNFTWKKKKEHARRGTQDVYALLT